jgi:hypothetical protein
MCMCMCMCAHAQVCACMHVHMPSLRRERVLPLHQPVAPEVRAGGRGDRVDHDERGGLLKHLRLEIRQAVLELLPTRRLYDAHARRELLGIDRRRAVRDEHPQQLHEPRRLEGALVVDVQHPRRGAAAIDQRASRQREAQLRFAHARGTDHLGDTARPEPTAKVGIERREASA